jgi:hypothetical protein
MAQDHEACLAFDQRAHGRANRPFFRAQMNVVLVHRNTQPQFKVLHLLPETKRCRLARMTAHLEAIQREREALDMSEQYCVRPTARSTGVSDEITVPARISSF